MPTKLPSGRTEIPVPVVQTVQYMFATLPAKVVKNGTAGFAISVEKNRIAYRCFEAEVVDPETRIPVTVTFAYVRDFQNVTLYRPAGPVSPTMFKSLAMKILQTGEKVVTLLNPRPSTNCKGRKREK